MSADTKVMAIPELRSEDNGDCFLADCLQAKRPLVVAG